MVLQSCSASCNSMELLSCPLVDNGGHFPAVLAQPGGVRPRGVRKLHMLPASLKGLAALHLPSTPAFLHGLGSRLAARSGQRGRPGSSLEVGFSHLGWEGREKKWGRGRPSPHNDDAHASSNASRRTSRLNGAWLAGKLAATGIGRREANAMAGGGGRGRRQAQGRTSESGRRGWRN